jgi:long-chain fatty acid transport protein
VSTKTFRGLVVSPGRHLARCVLLTACLSAPVSFAGGFALSEQDARATGRSGTGIAGQAAPSAVHYNPSALVGLRGPAASAGVSALLPNISAVDPSSGTTARNESSLKVPPHVWAAWGMGKSAVGLGFNAPFGGGLKWGEDWRGRFELVEMRLEVLGLHAAAAYAFTPEWSIGATVTGYQAKVALDRHLDFVSQEGVAHLSGGGLGVGASFGATWAPQNLGALRRVGLVARLPATVGLKGQARFENVPDAFSANAMDQDIRSSVTLPAKLGVGTELALGSTRVYADAEVTFWSAFKSFDVDFENDATPDVSQARNWQTAATFRVGAERNLGSFTGRAGLLFDMATSPSDTLSPSLPDSHRLGGSLGLGKGFGSVRGDLAYMLVAFLPRASTGEALPAQYSAMAHLFALTLSFGG